MRPDLHVPRVLVLAGQRFGTLDPLAAQTGVTHKCVVPVLGTPMIARVLMTLEAAFPDAKIYISIEDPKVLDGEPVTSRLQEQKMLQFVDAKFNLVDSVVSACEAIGLPLLITTADNVLTTVEALHSLAHAGNTGHADAIAVMAPKKQIIAAHPGGKGRYYEFRDGGYSNCNLFWIGSTQAVKAAEAFRGGGQFLKVPGRIVKAFGVMNLLLFRMKALTLERAFQSISRRLETHVRPLVLHDGRLAIDVDDQKSLQMTEEILSSQ